MAGLVARTILPTCIRPLDGALGSQRPLLRAVQVVRLHISQIGPWRGVRRLAMKMSSTYFVVLLKPQ